ncbi:hypothetical protein PLANPX_5679 [Lacipirellula parvula]|uniref:Uncharacterized protein n=1 Tax=Lacipirellula parvula TaxID=2650471 RepID=A0A5K7XJ15_9BACT|nr:hypothetical protein PLANPX_5679 [Lacipirellula parvula]
MRPNESLALRRWQRGRSFKRAQLLAANAATFKSGRERRPS